MFLYLRSMQEVAGTLGYVFTGLWGRVRTLIVPARRLGVLI